MKIALVLAAALVAAPAFSASRGGHVGRASSSFSSRRGGGRSGLGYGRPLGSGTSFSHFSSRAPIVGARGGTGSNGMAATGAAGVRARAGLSRYADPIGNRTVSCGPNCTAGPSAPSTPGPTLVGSVNHTVSYGDGGPVTQTVPTDANYIQPQGPATPVNVGSSPGITWQAHPDTPPGGGAAGGSGSTINQ